MMRKIAVALVVTAAMAGPAQAVMPASLEQILCSGRSAVIATVVEARSRDCRLQSADRYCYNFGSVGVTLRIDEVLAPSEISATAGDLVQTAIRARNDRPSSLSPTMVLPDLPTQAGAVGFPATDAAITDAEASRTLVGKQFIFSLHPGDPGKPPTGEPNFASIWAMSEETWVRGLWPTPNCSRWRR
ncbi:hypothetical protein QO010_000845 [Caulobacter ginsengisoli]|uniref:DUF11 domain-containing protein n=1 Tax=Caulobacter ginsengisoli TaxID=400775 RepID=A0ABU0IQ68_9CAUL|nr:hypothetical protein [Caulobacter ginsengisoli]MDQ0463097.1 hypothetical protein [Caulobacter ginsengisoli]